MESAGGGSSELQRNILPERLAEHLKALDAAVENIRSDYLILIGRATSLKSIPNFTSPVISLEPKRMAATGTLAWKRMASTGILAWTAFVKHIKQTRPEAFTGVAKESDKLEIVKRIRAHNMAAYNAFVEDWQANYDAARRKAQMEGRGGGGGGGSEKKKKIRRTQRKNSRK